MARKQPSQRNTNLPGSLYQRNRRWWWKVQLPREDKQKSRPLKPIGARYATTDYAVAVECAKCLLQQQLFQKDLPAQRDRDIISTNANKRLMTRPEDPANGKRVTNEHAWHARGFSPARPIQLSHMFHVCRKIGYTTGYIFIAPPSCPKE